MKSVKICLVLLSVLGAGSAFAQTQLPISPLWSQLNGHGSDRAQYSWDGSAVAVARGDSVVVCRTSDGKPYASNAYYGLGAYALSPNGNTLYMPGGDGIYKRNLATGATNLLYPESETIGGMAISPNGQTLAYRTTLNANSVVVLVDAATGQLIRNVSVLVPTGLSNPVFMPDSQSFVLEGPGVYRTDGTKVFQKAYGNSYPGLAVATDGTYALTYADDGDLLKLRLTNGTTIWKKTFPNTYHHSIGIGGANSRIILPEAGPSSFQIGFYNASTGTKINAYSTANMSGPYAYSPVANRFLITHVAGPFSTSSDGVSEVRFDTATCTGAINQRLSESMTEESGSGFLYGGENAFGTWKTFDRLQIKKASDGTLLKTVFMKDGTEAAFSLDGSRYVKFIPVGGGGKVEIRNIDGNTFLAAWSGATEPAMNLWFGGNNRILFESQSYFRVLEYTGTSLVQKKAFSKARYGQMVIGPDGMKVACINTNTFATLEVRDAATAALLDTKAINGADIAWFDHGFTGQGRLYILWIVTPGSALNTLRLQTYNVDTAPMTSEAIMERTVEYGFDGSKAVISQNGQYAALIYTPSSGGDDFVQGRVTVFDAQSGTALREYRYPYNQPGPYHLAMTPAGEYLLVRSGSNVNQTTLVFNP